MARIAGVEAAQAGMMTRLVYWFTRRKLGKVIEGVKVTAHSPKLLQALGRMEMAVPKLKSVDAVLVSLAEIKVAAMVGCPF